MAKSLSSRDKRIIYALSQEGKSQQKLADLYDVSQPTISNALKEMRYEERIARLENGTKSNSSSPNYKLIGSSED